MLREHLYRGGIDWHIINGDIDELEIALAELKGVPHTYRQRMQRELEAFTGSSEPITARFLKYGIKNSAAIAGIFTFAAAVVWAQYGYHVFNFMPPSPEELNKNPIVVTDDLRPPESTDLTGDGQFDARDAMRHIERLNESEEAKIERLRKIENRQNR